MALTPQEIDIAKKVKEQWGTQEDFMEILQEFRKRQPSEQTEEVITKVPEVWEEWFIWPSRPPEVREQARVQTEDERIESEEWLKWFATETWESLKRRAWIVWEAVSKLPKKQEQQRIAIQEKFKEWKPWAAFVESMKWELNKIGSAFQVAWQFVWAWVDVIWEWLENTLQEATWESVENALESSVAKIWETETVQNVASSYMDFRERNPESARNIEAGVNIWQILPITKVWRIVTKPISKTAKAAVRKEAEQALKDTGRAFLSLPTKTKPTETLSISKFFADKVKPTNTFDDVVVQFDKLGSSSIDKLNTSLKGLTKTYKPQWAKEVLKVIKENLEKGIKSKRMPFSKWDLAEVTALLKKFNKEWLNLSELNSIKKSINKYTKAWTAAGKEAAWVAPDAMRGKYTEVRKFIENAADKLWVKNVKELNADWANSNTLMELLGKQASAIGKKKWKELLQPGWVLHPIRALWKKVKQFREDIGLSDAPWAVWLEDIDLSKAIEAIKKIWGRTEAKTIQEKLFPTLWKKGLDKLWTTK